MFKFHLYRATVTIMFRNQVHVQCLLLSVRTCIGERDCHLDFTLPPLANFMGRTTLSKNINDRFMCVGCFFVFFQGICQMLIYILLHFIYVCLFKILASHLIYLGGLWVL